MLKPMLAVKDTKVGLFDPPFVVIHTELAIREWDMNIKNPQTRIGMHPSDYELYQIGTYNELTGETTSLKQNIHLASGVHSGSTLQTN